MRGFTLVETMVSAFLISVAFIGLFAIVPSSMLALKRSALQTVAWELAQSKVEHYRAAAFTHLPSGDSDLPAASIGGTSYNIHLQVTPLADRLKNVQITISWIDPGRGKDNIRQMVADSLICQIPK